MESKSPPQPPSDGSIATTEASPAGHQRKTSGGGLFSKLSFLRSNTSGQKSRPPSAGDGAQPPPSRSGPPPVSIANALQQQKTRRRRGSLRKAALLGRGAQRERRESRSLIVDTKQAENYGTGIMGTELTESPGADPDGYGLGISDITPRPSMDGYASRTPRPAEGAPALAAGMLSSGKVLKPKVEIDDPTPTSPTISYTTTDDEDVLHIARHAPSPLGPEIASLSSGSESYFNHVNTIQRRRSVRAKSPLSLTGLATTPLPAPDGDWDYTETEWWGWVVLIVTWVVFVTGMGSVFGVWNWAWDVGTTPYAPPELEDDPTLPITGYYPALIILTCVMAWVWVVVAWVGMKYFRHAKISGD